MINTAHLESDASELASLYRQRAELQAETAKAWLRVTDGCVYRSDDGTCGHMGGLTPECTVYCCPAAWGLLSGAMGRALETIDDQNKELAQTQAEAARLREVLRHLVYECENGCNLTIFDVIDKEATPLLAESHPVMPTVTNGDSSKQPQCGHPRAAIVSSDEGTTHCAWCEDVEAAGPKYLEGIIDNGDCPMCGQDDEALGIEGHKPGCIVGEEIEAARAEGYAQGLARSLEEDGLSCPACGKIFHDADVKTYPEKYWMCPECGTVGHVECRGTVDDEPAATCLICQSDMQLVRPGKWQCTKCELDEMLAAVRAEGVAAEQKQIYAAVFQIIQEWRYALVDGNSAAEPVPRNIVGDMLDCIELAARGAAVIRAGYDEEAQK